MRSGFTDFSASNPVDPIPNPNAPLAAAESLMKVRLVVAIGVHNPCGFRQCNRRLQGVRRGGTPSPLNWRFVETPYNLPT